MPQTKLPARRLLTLAMGLLLQTSALSVSADEFADQAPHRLQGYLQVNTINPPGNEVRGTAYLGKLLKAAGIDYETAESAPGRGNLWARLPGGDKPALVLLHHIDVVPANAKYWEVDPLSGVEKDGYIWGRGAIDTKGLGITQLQAFLAIKASGKTLNRDVIFMATADEEAGGFFGAGWLIEHHPEVFDRVGYLINEGGSGRMTDGTPVFQVEVTQKVPLWLRLTATDVPGHGSRPRPTSAMTRILRAGHRIADTQFAYRVIPEVKTLLQGMAGFETEALRPRFERIEDNIADADFMASLHMQQPGTIALLHNTCSVTSMTGSSKINVVSPTASIELDCRMLPDQDPAAFLVELKQIISDPNIAVEQIMGFTPARSSTATPLYESITRTLILHYENMKLVPSVSTGFTDSHFFRDMGIVSYGFSPFLFQPNEHTGVHGNNERITVENMVQGTKVMTDFLFDFTTIGGH
jgi:acetylornithine deacetylase/succinyl-diaminopimelate desuccinylase-like protein